MTTMTAADSVHDDRAVRQRLDSFKLGKSIPQIHSMGMPGAPTPGHRHQRSHSRNTSISSSFSHSSLASSRSSGQGGFADFANFSFGGLSSSNSSNSCNSISSSLTSSTSSSSGFVPPPATCPPSKRNSHHRRRSSVSTRHESAEMMGVSLPDLPPSSSEHNVNLGDKDSIRRRALWALEGKVDVAFSKVEIPELTTPDMEKLMFDFSNKSNLGASVTFGTSLMGTKRDSFKLLPLSGSSKDQLHTLVEEEEEEEEDVPTKQEAKVADEIVSSPTEEEASIPSPPSISISRPAFGKPRPATLNLRPLSLVPESLTAVQGLPTPTLSPSPRSGLRSLSLSPASSSDESPRDLKEARRDSLPFLPDTRRPALNVKTSSIDSTTSSSDDGKPFRRSSISYKPSSGGYVNAAGLPTPEMTPTFGRRLSLAESTKSGDEEFFLGLQQQTSCKPLSASEQHFLLKSHNALIARITDLERALSRRVSMGGYSSGSRPSSLRSEATTSSEATSPSGEVDDEMLSFVRDLKAERDELKKDVEGWRTRVNDLDRKHAILAKRVETERWEAWAARSRLSVLETEKSALEKRIEMLDQSLAQFECDKDQLAALNRDFASQITEKTKQVEELEAELKRTRETLEQERVIHQQQILSIKSSAVDLLATPTPPVFQIQPGPPSLFNHLGLGDDEDDAPPFSFTRNALTDEGEEYGSDDESGLIGYQDEEEYDESYEASSSFGSMDEYQRSTSHFGAAIPSSPFDSTFDNHGSAPVVPPRPTEQLRESLSFNWTFPRALPVAITENHHKQPSVDRFFNCLDESDASDDSLPASPVSFNYEQSKDMFASGFRFAADEEAPFFFPPGIGTVVEDDVEVKNERLLNTVAEEEQEHDDSDEFDDGDMFGDIGGITITFTPPDEADDVPEEAKQIQLVSPAKPASTPPMLPDLHFEEEDEDFMFGLPALPPKAPSVEPKQLPVQVPSVVITPPPSIVRPRSPKIASPPSSIPRPVSRLAKDSTSCKSPPPQSNPYCTPPTKRGGSSPSFIPQSVASPTPSRIAQPLSKGSKTGIAPPTFIRPPNRKPVVHITKAQNSNERKEITAHNSSYSFGDEFQQTTGNQLELGSQVMMKSVDLGRDFTIRSSHNNSSPAPASAFTSSFIRSPLSGGLLSSVLPWSWSTSAIPAIPKRQPRYVSREQQLAKLRFSLERGVTRGVGQFGMCDGGDVVFL